MISIHAPLTGSDISWRIISDPKSISIHAPLTGSDPAQCPGDSIQHDFNPRSPYGERPRDLHSRGGIAIFQSTLPLRGATASIFALTRPIPNFNPRSPYGERPTWPTIRANLKNFNPRSPYGERLAFIFVYHFLTRFKSTLPLRGATKKGLFL